MVSVLIKNEYYALLFCRVRHFWSFSWYLTFTLAMLQPLTKTFWFGHAYVQISGDLVYNQVYGSTWLYWLKLSDILTSIHLSDLKVMWAFLSRAYYLLNATLISISWYSFIFRLCVLTWMVSCANEKTFKIM